MNNSTKLSSKFLLILLLINNPVIILSMEAGKEKTSEDTYILRDLEYNENDNNNLKPSEILDEVFKDAKQNVANGKKKEEEVYRWTVLRGKIEEADNNISKADEKSLKPVEYHKPCFKEKFFRRFGKSVASSTNSNTCSNNRCSIEDMIGYFPEIICRHINNLKQERETSKAIPRYTRRLLLNGPAGTGKTTIAKNIAKITNSRFVEVKGSSVVGYIGEGPKLISAVFEKALEKAQEESIRTVIFIDEVDAFASSHTQEYRKEHQAVTMQLWQWMDQCMNNPYIVVIVATNNKEEINQVFLSRFEGNIVEIENPNAEIRGKLIEYYAKVSGFALSNNLKQELINETEELGVRAIEEIFKSAEQDKNVNGKYFIKKFKEAKNNLKKKDEKKIEQPKKDTLDKASQLAIVGGALGGLCKIIYDIYNKK